MGSLDPMIYSLQQTAWIYGIDPHTKKKLQNENRWNLACKQVHNSLKNNSNPVLCTEKVNNAFLTDIDLPVFKFIATSKLDTILYLDKECDLDYNFTEEKFDREINSKLERKDIIYFNTENNWQQIMDLLDLQTTQPFYVIKRMILDGKTLKKAWTELHDLYAVSRVDKAERFISQGVKRFDLDCVFDNRPELYLDFCNRNNLKKNTKAYLQVINNYYNQQYIHRINRLYKVFQT